MPVLRNARSFALLCVLMSACAAPQAAQSSPSARTTGDIPRAVRKVERSAQPPVDFVALMESITLDPHRLRERVRKSRGLVIVRWLDCETENPIKVYRHACGESIARELAPLLDRLAEEIKSVKLESRRAQAVRCRADPRPECKVLAVGECRPNYTIVFDRERDDPSVIAVVERNDWQAEQEFTAVIDRRVNELIARSARGCP